jgi:hypothetical protein
MTPRRSTIPGLAVLGCGLFLLLLVALPASLRGAAAARTDPFAGLDAINVTLEIGGPLDLRGSEEPELFAGELRRRNLFSLKLTDTVAQKIETCGLMAYPEAPDAISIDVFGRRERRGEGAPLWVYMVEVKVLNTTLSKDRGVDPEPTYLRPVIGVADDAGLEAALIDAAMAILSDELRNCRQ